MINMTSNFMKFLYQGIHSVFFSRYAVLNLHYSSADKYFLQKNQISPSSSSKYYIPSGY